MSRTWQPPIPDSAPIRSVRLRRVVRDTGGLRRHDVWASQLAVLVGPTSQEEATTRLARLTRSNEEHGESLTASLAKQENAKQLLVQRE